MVAPHKLNNMKEVREIKKLHSQLNILLEKHEVLNIDVKNKQRELVNIFREITKLKEMIQKIENTKTLKVSEHAIVRYFERIKGFNIEEIEKEIMSESVVSLIKKLDGNNGTYPNGSFSIILKNNTVVTVI